MTVDRPGRGWRLPEGVPTMDGRARWLFMAVWSATLVLVLVAGAAVTPATWRDLTAPASSFESVGLLLFDPGNGLTLGPPIGAEAERAGVRNGQRLIAIEGQAPAPPGAGLDRQFAGPPDGKVAIVTRSPDGVRRTATLTRDPARFDRALADAGLNSQLFRAINGLPVIAFYVLLGCAILLMVRRRRDRLAPWTSLMLLLMLLGQGSTAEWVAAHFADPLVAYNALNALAYALLIVVLAAFPNGRLEPRWSFWVAVVGGMVTVFATPLPNWQSNVALELAQFAAVAVIVWRYRRMPPGTGRQQIRWALFGFAASLAALIGLMICQYFRVGAESFVVYAWTLLVGRVLADAYTLLLMLAMTVSLMRYRLYGADATISRSVAAGALTLGLLAVFAAAEKVIELVGEQYFGQQLGALAGALGAAIAAIAIVPLHHRTTRWAERRFRSGLARLREGLPLLVGDLREVAGPQALADAALARVEAGVRASHGAVVLRGALLAWRDIDPAVAERWLDGAVLPADDGDLAIDRGDTLFPMRVALRADGVGLVGWLLLGPRPDGSFYGREERAALGDIADPVARALAIADARERRDAALAAREAARQAREDSLSRSVDGLRRFVVERYGVDPGRLDSA